MPEMILSDVTLMTNGSCIIVLEPQSGGAYRSVRPVPFGGHNWRGPFEHERGSCFIFHPFGASPQPPHIEDYRTIGLGPRSRCVREDELLVCLRRAEVSQCIHDLFLADPQTCGRKLFLQPGEGSRSICGFVYQNVRAFQPRIQPGKVTIDVDLLMPSNERMTLPIVDRDWRRFIDVVVRRLGLAAATVFLNTTIREILLGSNQRFARVGLTRSWQAGDVQGHWFMLDSLFPLPDFGWLDSAPLMPGVWGND